MRGYETSAQAMTRKSNREIEMKYPYLFPRTDLTKNEIMRQFGLSGKRWLQTKHGIRFKFKTDFEMAHVNL